MADDMLVLPRCFWKLIFSTNISTCNILLIERLSSEYPYITSFLVPGGIAERAIFEAAYRGRLLRLGDAQQLESV